MKLLKLLLLGSLLVVGCNNQNGRPYVAIKPAIIDGCEYLETTCIINRYGNQSITYTHKGNCTNEIHKVDCWRVK